MNQKSETLIFYEAPHRLKDSLKSMQKAFGNERRIVLAREVTKKFEEFLRGTVGEAVEWADENTVRGEFCVVVEGNAAPDVVETEKWWTHLPIAEHVAEVIEKKDVPSKEAIKEVAVERGLSKREVYQAYHI